MSDESRSAVLVIRRRSAHLRSIAAILLPISIFYLVLLSRLADIPYWDDYDSVLNFIIHFADLPTTSAKLTYFAASHHNEYRLIFENAIFILQFKTFSHVNFAVLAFIGDAFVLLIFYLLWISFLPAEQDQTRRLSLFLPVPFLLFQMNYAETLNWSMAGLQNLPVIAFSLAALTSLNKTSTRSFASACCFLALAIASSGNGFILYPVGLLMLLQRRRGVDAGLWTVLGIVIAAFYFHHYTRMPPEPPNTASIMESHPYLKPVFALSFIGSAIAADQHILKYASLPLALLLCGTILLMIKKRYWRENAVFTYFVLFVILTAIAVTLMRSRHGYAASFAPRYKVYSDLLLICCYEFACQTYMVRGWRFRKSFYRVALGASIFFCLACDVYGDHYLKDRTDRMIRGVELYTATGGTLGPAIPGEKESVDVADENNIRFREIIRAADRGGVYHFPKQ